MQTLSFMGWESPVQDIPVLGTKYELNKVVKQLNILWATWKLTPLWFVGSVRSFTDLLKRHREKC